MKRNGKNQICIYPSFRKICIFGDVFSINLNSTLYYLDKQLSEASSVLRKPCISDVMPNDFEEAVTLDTALRLLGNKVIQRSKTIHVYGFYWFL